MSCLLTGMPLHGQDISQIAKSDPLIITGSIGTNNTYYYSSIGNGYASPLSNSFYANLNISLYGFNMPFALYYTNDNMSFLDIFYTSRTNERLHDPHTGLYLMSDLYIVDEIIQELRQNTPSGPSR